MFFSLDFKRSSFPWSLPLILAAWRIAANLQQKYPLAFRDWDALAWPYFGLFTALTLLAASWAAVNALSAEAQAPKPLDMLRDLGSFAAVFGFLALWGILDNFLPMVEAGGVITFTEKVVVTAKVSVAYTGFFHFARFLLWRLGLNRSKLSYGLLLVPVLGVFAAAQAGLGLYSRAAQGHAHRSWEAPVEPGMPREFHPREGQWADFDRAPTALAIDGEGRLVCAGGFRTYAGRRVGRIARLDATGKLDQRVRLSDHVRVPGRIAVNARGDIYFFTDVMGGSGDGALLKISPDGEPDRLFTNEIRRAQPVSGRGYIAAQNDGKVLASRFFALGSGGAPILRFEPQGYPDKEFNERVLGAFPEAEADAAGPVHVQKSGKVLMGVEDRVYRFSPLGILDTSFLEPRERYPGLREIFTRDDEALYYHEFRDGFGIRTEMVRVAPEGFQILNFSLPAALRKRPLRCAAIGPGGEVYLGYDDGRGPPLVRLSPSGGWDMALPVFKDPAVALSGRVSALAVDNEGRVYVAGDLSFGPQKQPYLTAHLVRLSAQGEVDPGFWPDW